MFKIPLLLPSGSRQGRPPTPGAPLDNSCGANATFWNVKGILVCFRIQPYVSGSNPRPFDCDTSTLPAHHPELTDRIGLKLVSFLFRVYKSKVLPYKDSNFGQNILSTSLCLYMNYEVIFSSSSTSSSSAALLIKWATIVCHLVER